MIRPPWLIHHDSSTKPPQLLTWKVVYCGSTNGIKTIQSGNEKQAAASDRSDELHRDQTDVCGMANLTFHGFARPSFSKMRLSEVSHRRSRNVGSCCRRFRQKIRSLWKPDTNLSGFRCTIVQPGVTTNIIRIAKILIGSMLVSEVFPLYHVDYTTKDNDLMQSNEEVSAGVKSQVGNHFLSLAFRGSHQSEPGGVRTGSNQKCNQFPWFDLIPGRSCLLSSKYKFSAEYCLPFCRLLPYVSKMSPKQLRMFVILIISQEISPSGKLHTIFVAKFGGYVVHG